MQPGTLWFGGVHHLRSLRKKPSSTFAILRDRPLEALTAKGNFVIDKDFSFGYRCALMIEHAEIMQQ